MEEFYDSAVIREADRIASEELGVPGIVLMENAARGAAELITRLYPAARRIAIFCGPGNNGGDGFAMARQLLLAGLTPALFTSFDPGASKGDAAIAAAAAIGCGLEPVQTKDFSDETLREVVRGADVAVDALLGTGSKGAPRGETARIIPLLNGARAVVSLDLPSGIDPDSGLSAGVFVQASATATFLAKKRAFASEAGSAAAGEVFVCHIGVPPELVLR